MRARALAIHGVGNQEPGEIKRALEEVLANSSFEATVDVEEFNWNQLADHSPFARNRFYDTYWLLGRTAYNISAAARMGIATGVNRVDRGVGSLQYVLHRLSQWLVAAGISLSVTAPLLQLAVVVPSAWYGLSSLPMGAFGWLLKAPLAIAYLIAIGAAAILIMGALRLPLAMSLQPLVAAMRSVLLLVIQPGLVALSGLFALDWRAYSESASFIGFAIIGVSVIGYLANVIGSEPFGGGVILLILTGAILSALVLMWVLRRLSPHFFGGPIKVLLDIFRYLGEPHYRGRIQAALDQAIREARSSVVGDAPIVLVAHSLGTVIAVDSLINSGAWERSDRVLLVTMGSPLRRFFLNAFPGALFPSSVRGIAAAIVGRVRQLRWLNVYRPWDYIGTALGLNRAAVGRDLTTRQWGRVVTSHTDYWGDAEVLQAVSSGLQDLSTVEEVTSGAKPRTTYVIPQPPIWKLQRKALQRGLKVGRRFVPAVVFVSMLMWLWFSVDARDDTIQRELSVLADHGEEVEATVTYDEDNRKARPEYLTFAFLTITGVPHTLRIKVDETNSSLNARRLFDHRQVIRRCKTWRWWQFGSPRSCDLKGVRLRYLPNEPQVFDLPSYPPKPRSLGLERWLKLVYHSGLLSAFTVVPLAFGFSLFLLLLGHPLEEVPDHPEDEASGVLGSEAEG